MDTLGVTNRRAVEEHGCGVAEVPQVHRLLLRLFQCEVATCYDEPNSRVGFDVTAVGRAQAGHNLCESRRCLAQSAVHSFRSRHRSGERETCTVVLLYMYDVETGHGCTGDIGMHMDVELDGRYCAHFSSNSSNALTADERQARILGE